MFLCEFPVYFLYDIPLHCIIYKTKRKLKKKKNIVKPIEPSYQVRSAELPVRKDDRSNEGPEVKAEAQPAGAHLHPHGRHGARHGLSGGVGSGKKQESIKDVFYLLDNDIVTY